MTAFKPSEREWQATVLDTALAMGWRAYHPYDSRRSAPGWPDLALWHPRQHRFMLRELKSDSGRLSPAQADTISELRLCSLDVEVWRPCHWPLVLDQLRHS